VRVLATHSIRQFPFHFPSRASPCATRFRTSSTTLPGRLCITEVESVYRAVRTECLHKIDKFCL